MKRLVFILSIQIFVPFPKFLEILPVLMGFEGLWTWSYRVFTSFSECREQGKKAPWRRLPEGYHGVPVGHGAAPVSPLLNPKKNKRRRTSKDGGGRQRERERERERENEEEKLSPSKPLVATAACGPKDEPPRAGNPCWFGQFFSVSPFFPTSNRDRRASLVE